MTFFDNTGHTGQAHALLKFLDAVGIDIANCRGQSYDNASNMSGKYNGMQAIIRQKNPLAVCVPCAAHSLNLVGHAAVGRSRLASRILALYNNSTYSSLVPLHVLLV